jgi:predicted dehydrogenase
MIPALHEAEQCELRAIASRTPDLATIVAEDHGIPVVHTSYEELLADTDVDAVYIPLPNHLHARWIRRAVDAGKHVLCEKPLALTSRQAETVAAQSEERGVLVMEAFMYRFHPAWQTGRKLIAAGAIGTVTDVDIRFGFRSRRDDDYRMVPTRGGGALYDVGCYALNVSRMLLGDEPERVHAVAHLHPEHGVDMTMSAILDYGEARATFTCSMEQEPDHRVHIYGTEGWMTIEDPFNCPPDKGTRIVIATGGDDAPYDSTLRVIDVPAGNQYGLQATAFSRAILGRRPVPLPLCDTVANMRLIERVFAAAGVAMRRGGGIAVNR